MIRLFLSSLILIVSIFGLTSCGDSNKTTEKVTKGHRGY